MSIINNGYYGITRWHEFIPCFINSHENMYISRLDEIKALKNETKKRFCFL